MINTHFNGYDDLNPFEPDALIYNVPLSVGGAHFQL